VGAIRSRDAYGRWQKGISGNPEGRLPRQTESEYLEVTMATVSTERWAEVVEQALQDALGDNIHARARAREWLAKYLIGEPSQLMQLLYREEKSFEIIVTFGDNGRKELTEGDVIDVEPIILNES
jgi:hypothetical protein